MKENNNDLHFLGDIFAKISNDGYKSFENVFNFLYNTKENNSSFEPKDKHRERKQINFK